ncbi:MAG TPA: hypothetical protein PL033_10705 [Candidatus Brocadiia bacterium]|nr:hypothetical protein [Candidatus Brocadiia bacterium]
MDGISRRGVMCSAILGGVWTALSGGSRAEAQEQKKMKVYPNEHFYKADGTFNVEAAKAAFYEMFDFHKYPIVPRLKGDEFWVADFGLGKFTEIGMGGIFWLNFKEQNYFGHEIFLLPGQCIPEHKHVKTPDAGPKLESWHVRHGFVHIYGEGQATAGVETRIPPTHKECCKAKVEKKLMPGEVGHLGAAEQWHWMKGGDQGGIVTEYATYHDGKALRFSHSGIKF